MSTPHPGRDGAAVQRALARNDRYLRDFVEALGMCPFARTCREEGKLLRRVVWDTDEERILDAIREVERLPAADVEVALLLLPEGPESAQKWDHFAARIRERLGPDPMFYCVAFHPAFPRDTRDAARAVHLLRRSPDPTLQLVRASLLRQVRAGREGGSTWRDPALPLEAGGPPNASLSEAIAAANLETLHREGVDRVEHLLSSIRAGAR